MRCKSLLIGSRYINPLIKELLLLLLLLLVTVPLIETERAGLSTSMYIHVEDAIVTIPVRVGMLNLTNAKLSHAPTALFQEKTKLVYFIRRTEAIQRRNAALGFSPALGKLIAVDDAHVARQWNFWVSR